MEQTLRENEVEWEDQIAERKLLLIDDDINAAIKQIRSLENQKSELKKQIEVLNQSNSKLFAETTRIEDDTNKEVVEGTFFTLLAQLEAEEASLKGELQSYKDLQRTLGHEISKYTQMNKKLAGLVEIEEKRTHEDQKEIRALTDRLIDLNDQLDKKKLHLDELQKDCINLRQETANVTDLLKEHQENVLHTLLAEEREMKTKLEELTHEEKKLSEERDRARRDYEASVAECNQKIVKQQSISSWLHDRSVLIGKLKRARQQLQQANNSVNDCKKKEDVLAKKFKRLLQDDDPTGTGLMARRMVQAEIDEITKKRQGSSLTDEIELAQDHKDELTEKLEQVTKSVELFKAYRNETLRELNEELLQCSQHSYLNLLQGELNSTRQGTVSRF